MKIEKETRGTDVILKLDGWLDTQTAPEFGAEIAALGDDMTSLTLDMEKLEYISSAGLRQVVAAYKKVENNFKIVNVSSEIMDVFKMTGFDKRLNIE